MFIGAPDVGALTSLILALLVVLEIYIEYQFCYSIYTYLVKDLLEERSPATYRHWRETVARPRGFMDANMTSLVERICATTDDSVSVGGSQFEMLQIIDDYLEGSGASMIWSPRCCAGARLSRSDLRANALAARRRRRGRGRDPAAPAARAPPRVRRALRDPRAFSVALLFIGSSSGETQEIENVVLNAAALGFVLELSDLLLAVMPRAFVPRWSGAAAAQARARRLPVRTRP